MPNPMTGKFSAPQAPIWFVAEPRGFGRGQVYGSNGSVTATVARAESEVVRKGKARVVGIDGEREIDDEPITVGRDPACGIVLDDPEVSSAHFELSAHQRGIRVRDLDSLNGTFIGDVRVSEAYVTSVQRIRAGGAWLEIVPGAEQTVVLPRDNRFGPLVGGSSRMRGLFDRLARAARTDLTVMILGETGTGKELVARALHEASGRS